jgi:hypothetical protein
VKIGEQWHDNLKRSALARTFTVDSYDAEENGPPSGAEEARYVYCSPMFASNAGGRRSDALEGFFANLNDFAQVGLLPARTRAIRVACAPTRCTHRRAMQIELEIAKILIPAAAGLVGALGGAAIGASLALRRFQDERAFDRRIDWYERMIRATHNLIQSLGSNGSDALAETRQFMLTAAERDLYALPAGRDAHLGCRARDRIHCGRWDRRWKEACAGPHEGVARTVGEARRVLFYWTRVEPRRR